MSTFAERTQEKLEITGSTKNWKSMESSISNLFQRQKHSTQYQKNAYNLNVNNDLKSVDTFINRMDAVFLLVLNEKSY